MMMTLLDGLKDALHIVLGVKIPELYSDLFHRSLTQVWAVTN